MSERQPDGFSLLRLTTVDGPIFFIVRRFFDGTEDEGSPAYFFEESQCPTNFIGVEAVYTPDDDDPHGLFEHVRSAPAAGYEAAYQAGRGDKFLRALFPETVALAEGTEAAQVVR